MKAQAIAVPKIIKKIAEHIKNNGGQLWLVGGCVRDHLLGIESRDWDVEIHGVDVPSVEIFLKKFGKIKLVGKSFSAWKLNLGNKEIDISLPMNQNQPEPHLGIENALRRRDLRINAIAYDPIAENFADPHDGLADIKNKILQTPDAVEFRRDPLRAFRVVQFCARFDFKIAPELVNLCLDINVQEVAGERVELELRKMLLLSKNPGKGFRRMFELNLAAQVFPNWKPKDISTLEENLNKSARKHVQSKSWKLALLWTVALEGTKLEYAEEILDYLKLYRINSFPVRDYILKGLKFSHKMHKRMNDTELRFLAEEAELQFLAEIAKNSSPHTTAENLINAERLGVSNSPMPLLVQGRDLQIHGYQGKEIGKKLMEIRNLQLKGLITSREQALSKIVPEG